MLGPQPGAAHLLDRAPLGGRKRPIASQLDRDHPRLARPGDLVAELQAQAAREGEAAEVERVGRAQLAGHEPVPAQQLDLLAADLHGHHAIALCTRVVEERAEQPLARVRRGLHAAQVQAVPPLPPVRDEALAARTDEERVARCDREVAGGMIDEVGEAHERTGTGSNGSADGLNPLPKTPRSPARWMGSASMAHSGPPAARVQAAATSAAVTKLCVAL